MSFAASLRQNKELLHMLRMMVSETFPLLPIIVVASSPFGSCPPAHNTGHWQRVVLPTFVKNDCVGGCGIRERHDDMGEVYQRVKQ
jgi:hypothetical protein